MIKSIIFILILVISLAMVFGGGILALIGIILINWFYIIVGWILMLGSVPFSSFAFERFA